MEHGPELHAPTDSRDHADDLVVYASKGKMVAGTLFFFAFAVMSVVLPGVFGPMDRNSPYGNSVVDVLVQVGGGVMFGSLTVVALMSLFSSAPALVVSHQGFWVNSPLVFTNATISWAEIESLLVVRVGRYQYYRQTYLLIKLRDRQAFRARQNRLQALLWRLIGWFWGQSVVVVAGESALPMSIADLLGRIQARFQHELTLHGIQVQGG